MTMMLADGHSWWTSIYFTPLSWNMIGLHPIEQHFSSSGPIVFPFPPIFIEHAKTVDRFEHGTNLDLLCHKILYRNWQTFDMNVLLLERVDHEISVIFCILEVGKYFCAKKSNHFPMYWTAFFFFRSYAKIK